MAFYRWTIFAVKDAHAEYDDASAAAFDLAWVNSVVDEYLIPDPITTTQSTPLSVDIPHFSGTNWHSVKSKMSALLATRTGNAGIPLTYLVRSTRLLWEDTETMNNLQARRAATKLLEGNTYDLDNREFFRILLNTFSSTTLDNVVKGFQKEENGMEAWKAILANVEGGNYNSELKRQGDAVIEGAFFDPAKNFTIEQYFDKHVKSHELHAEANAHVPDWKKIDQFMKGIRCTSLQNDFRNIKDDPQYSTFTTMYNKINENYRTLISQGIIKPVSINKSRISQIDTDHNTPYRGGRNAGGRFGGRGQGRGRGRGNFYGRGRGCGGRHGRGGQQGRGAGRNIDMTNVNMQALPPNLDLNDLSFPDEQWYGFTHEQRNAVNALRRLRNSGRQDNNKTMTTPAQLPLPRQLELKIAIYTNLFNYHQCLMVTSLTHLEHLKLTTPKATIMEEQAELVDQPDPQMQEMLLFADD